MIWNVWHLANRTDPSVDVTEALDRRIDICRKTTVHDGRHPAVGLDPPNLAWYELRDRLAERVIAHASASDTAKLEDECWSILEPFVLPTIPDTCAKTEAGRKRPYRSWGLDLKREGRTVNVHFSNVDQPDSPFGDQTRARTAGDLLRLLQDAKSAHPDADRVECSSWLCAFPAFLGLFPPEFSASYTPVYDYYGTYGWWGQYMDHRGAYHQRNGTWFRMSGEHPYVSGVASAGLETTQAHLTRLIGNVG
jgi:hypothetical protein